MKRLRFTALACFLVAGAVARPAEAVSVSDLLNLRAHGLSEDVLVALIETDGSVFHLSASDIERLRERGMSDRLVIAMLEADKAAAQRVAKDSMRRHEAAPAPPRTSTTVVIGEAGVVIVPVPVVTAPPRAEPIYWGFGGNARPGSWTPPSQAAGGRPTKR